MSSAKAIQRIATRGIGVIGASWVAHYLAGGLALVATDLASNAEQNLRRYVDEAWKILSKGGLSGASGIAH